MLEAPPQAPRGATLRATVTGDGHPGPVEERLGRRLVRLVEPDTDEGRALLGSGAVEFIGPGGERFGPIRLDDLRHHLSERLRSRLDDQGTDAQLAAECLQRLRDQRSR
jgi:hypothetical protein